MPKYTKSALQHYFQINPMPGIKLAGFSVRNEDRLSIQGDAELIKYALSKVLGEMAEDYKNSDFWIDESEDLVEVTTEDIVGILEFKVETPKDAPPIYYWPGIIYWSSDNQDCHDYNPDELFH